MYAGLLRPKPAPTAGAEQKFSDQDRSAVEQERCTIVSLIRFEHQKHHQAKVERQDPEEEQKAR
jgi:hypothetical protein